MNRREYREVYLRSEHWRTLRLLALEDAEYRCVVCNASRHLDVHHRTYERLGNERLTDLTVLCRRCHDLYHASEPKPKGKKKKSKPLKAAKTKPTKKVLGVGHENERLHKLQVANRGKRQVFAGAQVRVVVNRDELELNR